MTFDASRKYDDIIELSRPASKHSKMPVEDRAKIFSPFAALRGYEETARAKEKIRINKIDLSEESKEAIDQKLRMMKKGRAITVTYFHRDPGSDGYGSIAEGEYITITGILEAFDPVFHTLTVNGQTVYFDDISDIPDDGSDYD